MTSKTELALVALVAAIETASAVDRDVLPAPLRNEALPVRLFDAGTKLATHVNIWDGDTEIDDQLLGADDQESQCELSHEAEIEFAVAGGADSVSRETAFDAGMAAILAAIKADRTLGGTVDHASVTKISSRQRELVTEGMPNAKGAVLTVRLEFTDSDIR